MTKFPILTAATVALLSSSTAFAATTIYGDRISFDAAAGATTTVDFEGCPNATSAIGTDQTVSSSTGPCGGIAAGITFAPQAGGELYISAAGQSSNPTIALGFNTPSGGSTIITLDSASNAFAGDFFQNFGGGSQSGSDAPFVLSIFSGMTLIDTFDFDVASGGGSFFGLISMDAFDRIEYAQTNGFAVIDNVSFGNAGPGAVPEPATWAFMIFGFGAIGGAMRRHRKANVKVSYA